MKRIAMIFTCLICFALGACMPTMVNAEQNHPLKIWGQNKNGAFSTLNVVDERTGVNYVVVGFSGDEKGGVAITPRLNADGSLYVTD